MKIEDITSRIERDAEARAEEIREEARMQAESEISEARKQAEEIRRDAEKRAGTEKEKIISQKKAVADIDTRLLLLKEKRERMEACFAAAEEKLLSMDRTDYYAFLAGIVKSSGMQEGEIILNEQDLADRETILAKVREAIPGGNFRVADEVGRFKGGLIVQSDKMFANGTVENYLEEARSQMTKEVADLLFAE